MKIPWTDDMSNEEVLMNIETKMTLRIKKKIVVISELQNAAIKLRIFDTHRQH